MKKRTVFLTLAAAAVLSLAAAGSDLTLGKTSRYKTELESANDAYDSSIPAFDTEKIQNVYTVREYREKIGIFKNGESEPYAVLDIYTFILPEKDRELLKNGFLVDEDMLYRVIEDYTG